MGLSPGPTELSLVAVATVQDNEIVLHASYREKPLVQLVPGVRWNTRREYWTLPLSWGSCIALRGALGDLLILDESVVRWAAPVRETIDYLDHLRASEFHTRDELQDIGIEFMIRAGSTLLTDEMRLGKSRQAILACNPQDRVLIIAPNSVKYPWKEQIERWAPERNATILEGTAAKRKKALEEAREKPGFVITNWENIRTMSRIAPYGSNSLTDKERTPGPLNVPWDVVIADEAHRAVTPKAKQTRALWAIGQSAARRIALTGTPLTDTIEDLWAVMNFVSPTDWPSKSKFIDRYCLSRQNYWGGLDVSGINPDHKDEFFAILDPHFLRRTRDQVSGEGEIKPDYQTRLVSMTRQQEKAYDQMANQMIAEVEGGFMVATNTLVRMTRCNEIAQAMPVVDEEGNVLRLETPSCKIEALLEILDEAGDEQVVVFASSKRLIDATAKALEKADITYATITGDVTPADRALNVERFQRKARRVLLLTVGAGSEGLTLSSANICVFLQRPWSFREYTQAAARITAVGKTEPSIIIDVVTKDCVEQRVLEILDNKDINLQELCRDPSWVKASLKRGS